MSEDTAQTLIEVLETLCDKVGYLAYLLEESQR